MESLTFFTFLMKRSLRTWETTAQPRETLSNQAEGSRTFSRHFASGQWASG